MKKEEAKWMINQVKNQLDAVELMIDQDDETHALMVLGHVERAVDDLKQLIMGNKVS